LSLPNCAGDAVSIHLLKLSSSESSVVLSCSCVLLPPFAPFFPPFLFVIGVVVGVIAPVRAPPLVPGDPWKMFLLISSYLSLVGFPRPLSVPVFLLLFAGVASTNFPFFWLLVSVPGVLSLNLPVALGPADLRVFLFLGAISCLILVVDLVLESLVLPLVQSNEHCPILFSVPRMYLHSLAVNSVIPRSGPRAGNVFRGLRLEWELISRLRTSSGNLAHQNALQRPPFSCPSTPSDLRSICSQVNSFEVLSGPFCHGHTYP
jgi:hypothetical protein